MYSMHIFYVCIHAVVYLIVTLVQVLDRQMLEDSEFQNL